MYVCMYIRISTCKSSVYVYIQVGTTPLFEESSVGSRGVCVCVCVCVCLCTLSLSLYPVLRRIVLLAVVVWRGGGGGGAGVGVYVCVCVYAQTLARSEYSKVSDETKFCVYVCMHAYIHTYDAYIQINMHTCIHT
jgi:hypothetical protein